MKLNAQTAIMATMAVIIVVLAWALIFYARDELNLQTAVPRDEIPLRSAVSREGGYAQVRISKESQAASGIAVQPLAAASAGATTEVYGAVVSVQSLIEARARYIAAVSDARSLRAVAANSAAEYQRQKRLYEDDRNVSERAVQAVEAAWKADQAKLAAAEQTVAAAHDSIRAGWGEVLAGWATNPESASFEALAQQREVLVQLTLPYDLQRQAGKSPLFVRPVSAPGEPRSARFVSPSPQTDASLPGVTYFYTVGGDRFRSGMRVSGQIKLEGKAREGVIVPAAAVVWHAGKAWAYVKEEPEEFLRKEVSTSDELANGWFDGGHFEPGDEVVVSGAQLLLSEELKFQIRNENED